MRDRLRFSVVAVAFSAIFAMIGPAAARARAEDWPQFRGPRGDGTSDARNLPTTWGGFDAPAWQTEIPGRGWSSPIVVGNRIWLTSAEQTSLPTTDLTRKLSEGVYKDFAADFQAHSSVTLLATEFDLATGKLLRTVELFTADNPPPIHATNSYASPTPVTDGKLLFCHFGSLGILALDLSTGKIVWQRRFAVDDITGPGSSPVLYGDKLIVPVDGVDQQYVVALDKFTGEVAWRTARPPIAADGKQRRAFSTPLVIGEKGGEQLIVPGAQWVVSYNPVTGEELWKVNFGDGHATVPRPVYRDGLVYICTGFWKPQLWAIRVDGAGDVTESHVAWKYEKQVPEISSPIVVGDEIYFTSSLGVLTCLDATTGRQLYQHRLGENFAASPIAADNKLYFISQECTTTIVRPGRDYHEIARNQLFGQTMASPAIAGSALLLRADRTLYRLEK
jgi:outer membrane protein assembly factor BamB